MQGRALNTVSSSQRSSGVSLQGWWAQGPGAHGAAASSRFHTGKMCLVLKVFEQLELGKALRAGGEAALRGEAARGGSSALRPTPAAQADHRVQQGGEEGQQDGPSRVVHTPPSTDPCSAPPPPPPTPSGLDLVLESWAPESGVLNAQMPGEGDVLPGTLLFKSPDETGWMGACTCRKGAGGPREPVRGAPPLVQRRGVYTYLMGRERDPGPPGHGCGQQEEQQDQMPSTRHWAHGWPAPQTPALSPRPPGGHPQPSPTPAQSFSCKIGSFFFFAK